MKEEAKKAKEAAKEAEEVARVRRETEALRRLGVQRAVAANAAARPSQARELLEEPEGQRKAAVQERACDRCLEQELECISQMG